MEQIQDNYFEVEKEQAKEVVSSVFSGINSVIKSLVPTSENLEKKMERQFVPIINNCFTIDGNSVHGRLFMILNPENFCKKKNLEIIEAIKVTPFSGIIDTLKFSSYIKKIEKNENFASYGSQNSFGIFKGSNEFIFPQITIHYIKEYEKIKEEVLHLFEEYDFGPFETDIETIEQHSNKLNSTVWISMTKEELSFKRSKYSALVRPGIFASLSKTYEGKDVKRIFYGKICDEHSWYILVKTITKVGVVYQVFKSLIIT